MPIVDDSLKESVHAIATISYAPNSYVIGNAYPGWTDVIQGDAQFSAGPGNEGGAYYRWGYLYGENFDRCAWIDDGAVSATTSHHGSNVCGSPQEIDTPKFMSTFTDGIHNQLAGDGSVTHMQYDGSGCTDKNGYGNVEPWRVPATPANPLGPIPDGKELRWRYVSRDGKWVLVRDPAPESGKPNWYFVHRGCVSVANVD
ncbi:MAG TPA: hypothetical protein VLX92_21715 [Kofleriaceae bacterium]|nr:hypothetical protein [Kofleriaceae bacterium]